MRVLTSKLDPLFKQRDDIRMTMKQISPKLSTYQKLARELAAIEEKIRAIQLGEN
jgi:hypothetical protein